MEACNNDRKQGGKQLPISLKYYGVLSSVKYESFPIEHPPPSFAVSSFFDISNMKCSISARRHPFASRHRCYGTMHNLHGPSSP